MSETVFSLGKLELDAAGTAVCGDLCSIGDSDDHPNQMSFTGTLLIVDEPSTKPPNGADGHRILVPKTAAKKNLDSLIGMGINYATDLSGHQPRRKVGVITKAWLDGREVKCSGIIWKKDFPEAVRDLKGGNLGMSMELADVLVASKDAPIWKLVDFSFTGATILYKSAAAYQKTSLAAAAELALEYLTEERNIEMSEKNKKKSSGSDVKLAKIVSGLGEAIGASIKASFEPLGKRLDTLAASSAANTKAIEEFITTQAAGAIAAGADEDETDSDKDSVAAGAEDSADKDDKDDIQADGDSSMASAKDDKESSDGDGSDSDSADSDDELDAELATLSKNMKNNLATDQSGDQNPELGKLNKNAKNKGRKNVVSASVHVTKIAAAAHQRISTLKASQVKLRTDLRKERKSRKALEAQVEELQASVGEFTDTMNRRTLPADAAMLLSKGGHDVNELMASGRKLTVNEVDDILASAQVNMKPEERITFKNVLLERGLMEQGEMKPRWAK